MLGKVTVNMDFQGGRNTFLSTVILIWFLHAAFQGRNEFICKKKNKIKFYKRKNNNKVVLEKFKCMS